MSSVLLPSTRGAGPLFDLVGRTPLIRLQRIEKDKPGIEVYAKAEFANPGGSVKDRPARRMLLEGLSSGALVPGKTLLDATSGNTGIAYAMFGAALGIPVQLCVPDNVTARAQAHAARLWRGVGAHRSRWRARTAPSARPGVATPQTPTGTSIRTSTTTRSTGARTTTPRARRSSSRPGGRLTHFVAGLGTSGTFVGVGRRLREQVPRVVLASLQPESPLHGIEGLKHMATAIVPGIYDRTLADLDLRHRNRESHGDDTAPGA